MAQHVVMTVSGTGTDMWDQTSPQPAAVANALPGVATGNSGPFLWQPVGNYPPLLSQWVRRSKTVYRN